MSASIRQRSLSGDEGLLASHPPLIRRILLGRGIRSEQELSLEPSSLHPPAQLLGVDAAVDLLLAQRREQGRILVVADFDADGATSCALVIRALRCMGFSHIDYIVPNRFEFGYGLTPEIVEIAARRSPDLILTVDNGISSMEGVATARRHGIAVLITDHHLPGEQLPDADAIVNPNQPGCRFPGKALAGVGVVFYMMLALRARLREAGVFSKDAEPNLASLLDLVALGTVADVVPLERNNRILVEQGLRRIRRGKACAGILALLELAGRKRAELVATDLGFAVAPRLNAAGRLEDMALGIECLLTDSADAAWEMARALDDINQQRRAIEDDMREQAGRVLEQMLARTDEQSAAGTLPAGLCLYDAQWHQGVVGILASRLKDRWHRPVIVFADDNRDGDGSEELKGSARSINGLHVRDALEAIATRNPGLISRFGGHAMAAGLSLARKDLPRFASAFDEYVKEKLAGREGQQQIVTDGSLAPEELTLDTAMLLRDYGPWGQGFPEPCFDGVFEVRTQRLLAGRHLKLVVALPGSSRLLDAIAFNVGENSVPREERNRLKLVYRLDVNRFRGVSRLQLIVEHLEPA